MSNYITNTIKETIDTLQFKIEEMTPLETKFFREKMANKFLRNRIDSFPIWERVMEPRFSIRDSNSFEWLDEFIQKQEVIMFFHNHQNPTVYIIHKGQSLVDFLKQIPDYMYHFTNESLDFLLCFSDADYLIAAGTAETWLRNKAIELSKTGWKDMDGKSFE